MHAHTHLRCFPKDTRRNWQTRAETPSIGAMFLSGVERTPSTTPRPVSLFVCLFLVQSVSLSYSAIYNGASVHVRAPT